MTFAYMDGGRWVVPLLQGLTTDSLKMVSLYGMYITASLMEYSEPAGEILQKKDHVSHSYVGIMRLWHHWVSRELADHVIRKILSTSPFPTFYSHSYL